LTAIVDALRHAIVSTESSDFDDLAAAPNGTAKLLHIPVQWIVDANLGKPNSYSVVIYPESLAVESSGKGA